VCPPRYGDVNLYDIELESVDGALTSMFAGRGAVRGSALSAVRSAHRSSRRVGAPVDGELTRWGFSLIGHENASPLSAHFGSLAVRSGKWHAGRRLTRIRSGPVSEEPRAPSGLPVFSTPLDSVRYKQTPLVANMSLEPVSQGSAPGTDQTGSQEEYSPATTRGH